MKVTSVDIYIADSNLAASFSFRDPTSQNAYIAKEISGLDADEILPKFYGVDLGSRKQYDLLLGKRDIVIKIGLNPDYSLGQTYPGLRDDLYKVISSSRTGLIEIQFKNGATVKAAISGFVTKFETLTFTKTPEIQMTVSCNDSMLRAVEGINVDIEDLDADEFVVTDTESTAPHGFSFGVIFTDTVDTFTVQDVEPANWMFEVGLTGSPLEEFVDGDELHFSSEANSRYLYIVRDLEITHLIDRIFPTSVWPILFPGTNNFKFSGSLNLDYITYFPTYWGV